MKGYYGVMDVIEARSRKALEDENARISRRRADSMLSNEALKIHLDKWQRPPLSRSALVDLQVAWGMSERRACRVLGCCAMTMRY